MKLLLYCTKAKPYLLHMPKDNDEFEKGIEFSLTEGKEFTQACIDVNNYKLNGKIVAECDFGVEEIEYIAQVNFRYFGVDEWFVLKNHKETNLYKHSCLGFGQMLDYFKDKLDYDTVGYAIHIKNLNIFDKPKELNEYYTQKKNNIEENEDLFMDGILYTPIKSAPQNMMYAKQPLRNDIIIISIRPEWLCKILNGEKTIEVRKKVLKEML